LLAKLLQYRSQLKQTDKELEALGKSKSGKQTDTEQGRQEMLETFVDDAVDSAKDTYDSAKEQFRRALKIVSEHVERETQVVQKVTN
jgi:vacuolar-type H+-ATPase subunit H